MRPIPDFTSATEPLQIQPVRAPALVVFDINGVRFLDHPVAGASSSTLMTLGGYGDLVRNKPRVLARCLLSLPDVIPGEKRSLDSNCVDVPMVQPDRQEFDECTTWTVIPELLVVDQIGAQRAQFTFIGPAYSDDIGTLTLRPSQWWYLVRVLVSLDEWMIYMRAETDKFSIQVRRSALAEVPAF